MIDYSDIPRHPWLMYRDQELEWVSGDSYKEWCSNMQDPERRKVLEKYGWDRPGAITYKFNSAGFRCDQFSDEPGMIALGCSFTGGLALPYDHIWAHHVSKQLNLKLWNLGVPGVGMDTCFRLLHFYIDKLNVKIVCLLRPSQHRFELYGPEKLQYITSYSPDTLAKKIWFQNEKNSQQNFLKNTMAIQYLCIINNVKLVMLDVETDLFNTPARDPWPPARDLKHVGSLEHSECARRFLLSCDFS